MGRLIAFCLVLCAATTLRAETQPTPLLLAVYVSGSSVYSVRSFTYEFASSIGKPVTTDSLEALRAAIRTRYVSDGYISPIIAIPPEELRSSTPCLYVYEARLAGIALKGDAGPYRERILAELDLLHRSVLRKQALREVLGRIRKLPGISADLLLDPQPQTPNDFMLVLTTRYRPVGAELDTNNGGTRDLGRVLYAGSLWLNGLLGVSEQIRVQAATSSLSDRYQYLDGAILRWFGGTQGSLEWQGTEAAPDPNLRFSDRTVTLGLRRALVSGSSSSLVLLGTVNGDNSVIHDTTNTHLVDDRIRSLAMGLQYQTSGGATQTSVYSSVNRAVSVLGATSLDTADSRVNVDFTKYLLGLIQSFSFGHSWSARVSTDAQVTSDVLPVVEKFAFGGLGLGDAFDPATLVGDSGVDLSAEVAHGWRPHFAALQTTSIFARADYGIVWNNGSYLSHRDEAASVSLGVLARWPALMGTLSLSTPVHQPADSRPADSLRALVSLAWML